MTSRGQGQVQYVTLDNSGSRQIVTDALGRTVHTTYVSAGRRSSDLEKRDG